MAKNKASKFNVDAELNYSKETIDKAKKILESIPEGESKKLGRPIERPETYRFSLYLDGNLKDYIKFRSWKSHQSITQYLNGLIRADMNSYIEKGGSEEEWITEK